MLETVDCPIHEVGRSCSAPTPEESPIGVADAAEIALNGRVRSRVRHGGPGGIRMYACNDLMLAGVPTIITTLWDLRSVPLCGNGPKGPANYTPRLVDFAVGREASEAHARRLADTGAALSRAACVRLAWILPLPRRERRPHLQALRHQPTDLLPLETPLRPGRLRRLRQPTWGRELVLAVLHVREQYPRWCKDKLAVVLRRGGWTVSTSMVGRILSN